MFELELSPGVPGAESPSTAVFGRKSVAMIARWFLRELIVDTGAQSSESVMNSAETLQGRKGERGAYDEEGEMMKELAQILGGACSK